jgi:ATP-dependent protease ClpP protease subunit
MKLNNLDVMLTEKEASILITAEISQDLAHDIEAALRQIFGYYQYDAVTFRLSTPGGSLTALTAILQTMERWRSIGRKVNTEASFQAASAGALLLAMGEVGKRTVHPYSSLLFHHTRIGGTTSAITAGAAVRLATSLKQHDQSLLKRMVDHISEGMGGTISFAEEGAARCEHIRQNSAQIAKTLDRHALGKTDKWLSALMKMYGICQAKASLDHYQRYLELRLNQDSEMDLREAYALCVIDGSHRVPLLVANASEVSSDRPPENRLKLAV